MDEFFFVFFSPLGITKYPTPENIDFLISKDLNPRSSYLLSKIVGEYLLNYSRLNFVIFRPHNIFGPQMGFVHVIPQIINKMLKNKKRKIIIHNSNHKRTFCEIGFAIELMINIAHHKKLKNKIFNIGSPDKEITIMNLAQKIKKILKTKNKLMHSNLKKDNSPEKRKPDMKRSIGFTKRNHNSNSIIAKVIPKTISADKSHLAVRRRGSREFKYRENFSLEVYFYYTPCTISHFGYFFKVLISPKPQNLGI